MRGVKKAVTDEGAELVPCPGCAFVMRSHPEMEELDPTLNWTRTCPRCERKLCITCYPKGAANCVLDDCYAVMLAREEERTASVIAQNADADLAQLEANDAANDKYWEDQ